MFSRTHIIMIAALFLPRWMSIRSTSKFLRHQLFIPSSQYIYSQSSRRPTSLVPTAQRPYLTVRRYSTTRPDGNQGIEELVRKVEGDEEMERLGQELALSGIAPGNPILLTGDLGTGKTTFARGFIRAYIGEPDMLVTSPSYLLDNTYEAYSDDGEEEVLIHHIDLYRLSDDKDLHLLGFPDILIQCICLIEWPDRLGKYVPKCRLEVDLKATSEETRDVIIRAIGGAWTKRILSNLSKKDL